MTDPQESSPPQQGSDGLRDRVATSVGWVTFERWGSRLLQMIVFAILARLLAPSAFGLVASASAVLAILQVLVDSGFSRALIQIQHLERRDSSTAFWATIAISVVIYGGLFAVAPLVAGRMDLPGLTNILRFMGLMLPLSALSRTPAALLEREMGFKTLSVRQVAASTIGAAVAVPGALAGWGPWALVAQNVTISVASGVILWAATPWRPSWEFSLASLRKLLPVGIGVLGTDLLDAVQGNLDKFVVAIYFSAETLGYYFIAQRLGTILIDLVTTILSRVSLTTFSRVQGDLPRVNRIYRQMTFVAGLSGVPVFGLVALLAPQILPVLFGPGWEPSIPIMWGLAGGWAFGSVMYFDRQVLLATGRAFSAFWLALVQNAVGVALVFSLAPVLGLAGVVVSRWASFFVWPLRLWFVRRATGLKVGSYLLQVFTVVGAFVPSAVLIALLQRTAWADAPWALLSFAVPVGVVALALYLVLAWTLTAEENREAVRPVVRQAARWIRQRLARPGLRRQRGRGAAAR